LDQPLIKELAKYNIVASLMVWDDPNTNWSDFDYLIFRKLGIILKRNTIYGLIR
jgi:hypothetical protein